MSTSRRQDLSSGTGRRRRRPIRLATVPDLSSRHRSPPWERQSKERRRRIGQKRALKKERYSSFLAPRLDRRGRTVTRASTGAVQPFHREQRKDERK
ncbi:hypothetical protein SLE2022_396930 [Rubroshorea leprosula]